jgi:hypothetical protein
VSHTTTKDKPMPKRNSALLRLMRVPVVILILLFACVLVAIFRPQDMSDISTGEHPTDPFVARDLNKVFAESIQGAYPLRITEEEINAYIAQTIEAKQCGAASGFVRLEKVLVRLEVNRAEIILVRKIGDFDFTISLWITVNQFESHRGQVETIIEMTGGPMPLFAKIPRGGRFGSLVVPQGFLHLVNASFIDLAEQFPDEITNGIEEMARIRIEEDALVLDPRSDQGPSMLDF